MPSVAIPPVEHFVVLTLYIKPVSTLLTISRLVEIAVLWQIHRLYEYAAGDFAGAARGDVVWVAGNPQGYQMMPACQRQEERDAPGCVMVSSVGYIHAISDMAAVLDNTIAVADPQINVPDGLAVPGKPHLEDVSRDERSPWVCRSSLDENQLEAPVGESSGVYESRF